MRKFGKLFAILLVAMVMATALVACGDNGGDDPVTPQPTVYTVKFDTQGGNSVESRTSVPGGTIQAPTEPIRIGYRFVGWYLDSACTGNAVSFPFTVNANVTLYAKWALHPLTSEAIDNYMNSEFGDSINGYYQKTVDITVATYDFGGLSVPAGVEGSKCYFGIYSTSDLDKGSILYVSDQTQWLTMFGAGSTSGARKDPVFELTKGNNYFYILFINYEDNSTKTYNFNIRQGSSYTVTFRNSDQNYYRVEVPFKGTVFDPNDINNSRYAGKTYTVTDPNGEEIDVWDGILYEEDVPAEIEARAGYTFEYWYYYEDNQNKYAFKTNIEINSDMTLYAEWKAKSYTVNLSPAGCDVLLSTTATVTYGQGGAEFAVPQKYQAVFDGWYYGDRQMTTKDGRLLKVWDIDIDNVVLTAKWTMNQYNVTLLNTNDGAGSVYLVDADGEELGTSAKLDYGTLFDIEVRANDGYRFKGWTTAENTDTFVDPPTTVMAKDVTYYAQWEIVKYTLTFDVANEWIKYETVEEPDEGGNVVTKENVTIIATPDNSARLLNAAGETIDNLTSFVMSVENGTSSFAATKEGYSFAGWYYVQNGKAFRVGDENGNIDIDKIYSLKLGQSGEDQAVRLVAGYSINSYKLSVSTTKTRTEDWIAVKVTSTKGAQLWAGTLAEYKHAVETGILTDTFEYGTTVELTVAVPEDQKDVYSFEAWVNAYVAETYGRDTTYKFSLNKDMYVKAQFGVEQYSIIWKEKGIEIGTAEKGSAFRIDRKAPEKEGHTFVGWKLVATGELITDANGEGLGTFMFNNESTEDGKFCIYVNAEQVANTYRIDVSVSDAEAGTAILETSTGNDGEIVYGGYYTLTAVTNPGYTFVGWFSIVNGTRQKVEDSNVLEMKEVKSTSDVSYEAVWEANRYLVKVAKDDGTVSLYVAIFGKEYLLKIGAEDELDKVQDVQANRVFTLGADAREFYEFIGWKYSLSNVFYRLTDETGAFTEEKWHVLSGVEAVPVWRSIYNIAEDGSLAGLTDYGIANYTEITVPSVVELTDEEKLTVSKVTVTQIAANAFENCAFLTKVTLSNDIVTIGEAAFAGCVNLAEFVIGTENAGVSLSKLTEVGANAFRNATALEAIAFPVTVSAYGDSVLSGCSGLKEVSYNGNMAFGKLFGSDSYENSYSVIQNGVNYYVPNVLVSIKVTAGISKIANYCFANLTKVENITYPDTVTSIGTAAFENSGITAVDFTNIIYIGANAFSHTNLSSATLSDKLEVWGSGAFSFCEALTSVVINHNPSEIPSSLFEGCKALTSVEGVDSVIRVGKAAFKDTALTSFATVNNVVAVGDYAFKGVTSLATDGFTKVASIGIEAFEATGVIGQVFYKAENASSVISDGVLYVAPQAFKGLAVTSVAIPASVIEIGEGAFENCTSLASVTFAAAARIRYILPRAFYGCTALNGFTVPTSVVQIGYEAFASSGLQTIDLAAATDLRVVGDRAFAYSKLSAIVLPESVRSLGTEAFRGVVTLSNANIGSLTAIPDGTFRGCSNLNEFTINETIVSIGNKAFAESGIVKVTVNGMSDEEDKSALAKIGEFAFENAEKFTGFVRNEYTRPKKDAEGNPVYEMEADGVTPKKDADGNPIPVTETVSGGAGLPEKVENVGSGAFKGNVKLAEFAATGLKKLADNLFAGCEALEEVRIGQVTEIGDYAFYNCKALTDIYYGPGDKAVLNKFGASLASIGDSAFENCVNLFDQNINSSLTALTEIGNKAFYDNKLITALEIPQKVTVIGSEAFSGCSSVSTLTFQEGSALATIGYEAFRGCRGITEVKFGDTLSVIERDAFGGCSSLETIVFGKGITSIGARAFAGIKANAKVKFVGEKAPILDANAFDQDAELSVKWLYEEAYKSTEGWAGYNVVVYYEV